MGYPRDSLPDNRDLLRSDTSLLHGSDQRNNGSGIQGGRSGQEKDVDSNVKFPHENN